jgi:hypothetical protein
LPNAVPAINTSTGTSVKADAEDMNALGMNGMKFIDAMYQNAFVMFPDTSWKTHIEKNMISKIHFSPRRRYMCKKRKFLF